MKNIKAQQALDGKAIAHIATEVMEHFSPTDGPGVTFVIINSLYMDRDKSVRLGDDLSFVSEGERPSRVIADENIDLKQIDPELYERFKQVFFDLPYPRYDVVLKMAVQAAAEAGGSVPETQRILGLPGYNRTRKMLERYKLLPKSKQKEE